MWQLCGYAVYVLPVNKENQHKMFYLLFIYLFVYIFISMQILNSVLMERVTEKNQDIHPMLVLINNAYLFSTGSKPTL